MYDDLSVLSTDDQLLAPVVIVPASDLSVLKVRADSNSDLFILTLDPVPPLELVNILIVLSHESPWS